MLSANVMVWGLISQNRYKFPWGKHRFSHKVAMASSFSPNSRRMKMALTNTAEKWVMAKTVM